MSRKVVHTTRIYFLFAFKFIHTGILLTMCTMFLTNCGLKTGILLDPPEFVPTISLDKAEFTHVPQVNESSFRGYHVFYKIVDNNVYAVDLTEESGRELAVKDFYDNVAYNESRMDQMMGDTYTFYQGYGFLLTIVKNDFNIGNDERIFYNQIPDNDDTYFFSFASSTSTTLDSSTGIYFSNFNATNAVFILQDNGLDSIEVKRHHLDVDNVGIIKEPFSSDNITGGLNADPDVPSTITDNIGSYSISVLFFGLAFGRDIQNIVDTIYSDPEFLGVIRLDKS